MRQAPVRASSFLKIPKQIQDILIQNGAVPVNDIFFPLWDDDSKILLLYGGWGSGKSVFWVDKVINECMHNSYFRCFYGRKIYDTIRQSIFATFTDRIEERGLVSEFRYSKSDNSSMIIKAKESGGTFHPFGADNASKLQSIKDPSHIICEEMDQFSEADFGVFISRLRTPKVKTKLIGAFNTTKVKEGHWIKKTFFSEEDPQRERMEGFSITKVFCNYPDNHFINQKEYEQTLWIGSGFNERKYNEVAAGAWGIEEVGNPFIFNFDRKNHVVKDLKRLPNLPVILSFDFNTEPITCVVGQCDQLSKVRILDEYRLMNSDIEELCNRILTDYWDCMFLITGDASGQNRTALKRDLQYFKEIQRVLKLGMGQFKVPAANPPVKKTRILCNSLLKKHRDYYFSDRVPYLIMDIEQCEVDENGDIDKDKKKHQTHLLDCWRYFNWTFLHNFVPQEIYDKQ